MVLIKYGHEELEHGIAVEIGMLNFYGVYPQESLGGRLFCLEEEKMEEQEAGSKEGWRIPLLIYYEALRDYMIKGNHPIFSHGQESVSSSN